MESIHPDTKPKRSFREWAILGGVGLLILVLGGVLLVTGYRYAKEWRAHSLLTTSQTLLAQPDTAKQGASELMAAYHLEPEDPLVLRGMADFEAKSRKGSALALYNKLLTLPNITREDRRAAARAFISFGDLKRAQDILEGLISDQPEADDYALQGELNWANHQRADAIEALRKAVSLAPSKGPNQLLLAQLLILMPDDVERSEGTDELKKLALQPDVVGLQALETICQIHDLGQSTQQWILDQFRKNPFLDDSGRLTAWGLEKQLENPDTVFQRVVEYFQSTSVERKAVAARWLYSEGQADLAMELAPPDEALTNQNLFLVRLDSLAFEKKWNDVAQALTRDDVPLAPTLLYLYRARVAHEMGDDSRSATNWDKAREVALSQPGMLNYAGNYALQLGMFDEAKKTFVLETHVPELSGAGFRQLLELEEVRGTDSDILDTLGQMLVAFPGDQGVRNDWAYMSLLLHQNMDQAAPIAQSLVNAQPNFLTYRTTLALCFLAQNDPPGALTVYQGLNIDWKEAPMSGKCIYAAVLAANGRKDESEAISKMINFSQLRPSEQELLKRWVQ